MDDPTHDSPLPPPRIRREMRTVALMIELYCRAHHDGRSGPCAECDPLRAYAHQRLAVCRYGAAKPACNKCPVHCYKPAMRERIRRVMRFAGPRMIWRHPMLALIHLLESRRPVPEGTFQQRLLAEADEA
ncbi:MAG: nitrous oxide-stimulated promoter family protein [bacterium]|jgi:hypothetical protein|nr:nitrous oxide-stimulated promoter family protein [bacterium]